MNCDYCEDRGVVGGTMPWRNGGSHANPCAYCTSSPAMKFKPGVTPWTGVIMPVPDVDKDTPGFSTYAEPDLPGDRVIIVVDPRWRMWCWSETGRYEMSPMLAAELTVLGTQLIFDGFNDRYACGVAFEGIMQDDTLAVYMAVPLLALLDGEDDVDLGARRYDLDEAVKAVGEALSYTLVPRVMVHVSPKLNPATLEHACDKLGVDSIMVKQTRGRWGVTPCWSRYRRAPAEEDF